jgi:hypothetical protein
MGMKIADRRELSKAELAGARKSEGIWCDDFRPEVMDATRGRTLLPEATGSSGSRDFLLMYTVWCGMAWHRCAGRSAIRVVFVWALPLGDLNVSG